ncbi:hypothetical protein CBOM_05310 [Ceraceosorus bombacis]|uniref:Uncharacterized protein n=1 Tax=Ceraceosorus bombacis TaxID=401625 RepID=A0A0P1BRW0_9BASI|nr:hypothetical protein CBOM_05310 [Ceraceosorus bombacis]
MGRAGLLVAMRSTIPVSTVGRQSVGVTDQAKDAHRTCARVEGAWSKARRNSQKPQPGPM